MDKSSSDEKLLKIIEGANKVKLFPQVGIKAKAKKVKPQLIKLSFKDFTLQNVNKGLFVIGGFLTFYFLYSFMSGRVEAKRVILSPPVKNLDFVKFAAGDDGKALDINAFQDVSKRNMFFPVAKKPVDSTAVKQSEVISEAVKPLKLVGVIWSDNPEVMVEDAKENRTYLLKKSDTFGQQKFKVKEILRNSVILEIAGVEGENEWELR